MELSYIAGLFDGEGCVAIRRVFRPSGKSKRPCEMYTLLVQISNTDLRLIVPLREKFGGSVHISRYKNPTQRDCYMWCAGSQVALDFLKAIRPWLIAKAEQADIAIEFQEAKCYRGKLGMPEECRERERSQYREIAALKFRTFNPTDFGMVANSGNNQRGRPRAKQPQSAVGVCNEQVPPSTEKICSELHRDMQSATEMVAPRR